MKKITTLTMLIFFTASVFAQQPNVSQNWKDSDLYRKSKTQSTAGWILAGAGTAGLIATLAADMNQMAGNTLITIYSLGTAETEPEKSYTAEYALSTAAIMGGVYLLIKSRINRNKARTASVFIDMERSRILSGTAFVCQSFPVVGLRVRL